MPDFFQFLVWCGLVGLALTGLVCLCSRSGA